MPESSHRLSATPYFPGAWPASSRDHHDDDPQDADVSSVSSRDSYRVRRDNSRKARRRWTYAGPARSPDAPVFPETPSRFVSGPNTSQEAKMTMSPYTENTLSTARSSPLNTPDLADWPTQLAGGSQSLLLESFPPLPSAVTRFCNSTPARKSPKAFVRHPRLLSTPSRPSAHFPPSPRLDPPLLNFISGVPPLRQLPDSNFLSLTNHSSRDDVSSAPHERAQSSPQFTVSSTPSETDSPVLPATAFPDDDHVALTRSPSLAPQMDAFALATAVAASVSRSSFAIPPSVQSVASAGALSADVPQSDAYMRPSGSLAASAGHRSRDHTHSRGHPQEVNHTALATVRDESGSLDHTLTRRLSAPQPSNWHASRSPLVRTISSRVDVGEDPSSRRARLMKAPVLGKVRKFGERLRGLFKTKGGPASASKAELGQTGRGTEYGMMTTTTAVTNVEYESEHPIPLPSPRARMMRNHRRSLPLPLFLSSLERVHSDVFSRPPARVGSTLNVAERPTETAQTSGSIQQSVPGSPTPDPRSSPRTPKARRNRTQTAPQSVENVPKPPTERKARRFSLSSALAKSRMESIRSTVLPRPPVPALSSRIRVDELGVPIPDEPALHPGRTVDAQEQYWGAELPQVPHAPQVNVTRSSSDLRPERSRTQTAPSHPLVPSHRENDVPVPKDKRSRRFSLSSVMAKRSSRQTVPGSGGPNDNPPPLPSLPKTRKLSKRRSRRDTVTTVTHGAVHFDIVSPRSEPDAGFLRPSVSVSTDPASASQRSSLVPSVMGSVETAYYDAREDVSDDEDHRSTQCHSPRPESDLDSMSFARTPDYSSATFSFGSSTEREYYLEASDPSMAMSRSFFRDGYGYDTRNGNGNGNGRGRGGGASMAGLVGESSSTPVTKTLRFKPSLSLSFDMSCSDFGEDEDEEDDVGRMEREEELSFMRALGFEFDEIARRVREEPL